MPSILTGRLSANNRMTTRSTALLLQSDSARLQELVRYFSAKNYQLLMATTPAEVDHLISDHPLDLVVVDLARLDEEWHFSLQEIRRLSPQVRFVFTDAADATKRQESEAEQYNPLIFFKQPFSAVQFDAALLAFEGRDQTTVEGFVDENDLPAVRAPIRRKLTLPYILLALCVALLAAYIINQLVSENVEERFRSQLLEAGQLTSDFVVREEERRLETMRLVVNTDGVQTAIIANDAERLREIVLPLAVNAGEEAIEILDVTGTSILGLRHIAGGNVEEYNFSRGDQSYAAWPFVARVMAGESDTAGDKFSGIVNAEWGEYLYVAGPINDADGNLVGVILIGKSLTSLARDLRQDTFAQITIYGLDGRPLETTLPAQESLLLTDDQLQMILDGQDSSTFTRMMEIGSLEYTEVNAPLELRGGEDVGLIGSSLSNSFLVRASRGTQVQIFFLITIAFLAVTLVGVSLANRITQPLLNLVHASSQVARGNLETKVEPTGQDEIAVLGHSFNRMVANLREGAIYRDLLGRTVTTETREEMRKSLESGDLRIDGQKQTATVLVSDIRGFSQISENAHPTVIFSMLNEYFGKVVPAVNSSGGVVADFGGDALLAYFGLLPKPLDAQASAYQACRAALKVAKMINALNAERRAEGLPLFVTGLGINTGEVTAGGVGSGGRMQYTVLGETLSIAQKIEPLTKLFDETGVVVTQATYDALGDFSAEFKFESISQQIFEAKSDQIQVYRLWPKNYAFDEGTVDFDFPLELDYASA